MQAAKCGARNKPSRSRRGRQVRLITSEVFRQMGEYDREVASTSSHKEKTSDTTHDDLSSEPPYKRNLERLELLKTRLNKVQKTAESLLATVTCNCGMNYTNKLVKTDLEHLRGFISQEHAASAGFRLDDENAVEIRFRVKCEDNATLMKILSELRL